MRNKEICECNNYALKSVKLDSVMEFIVFSNKFIFRTHKSHVINECNRKLSNKPF